MIPVLVAAVWAIVGFAAATAARRSARSRARARLVGGGTGAAVPVARSPEGPGSVRSAASISELGAALIGRRSGGRATRVDLMALIDELSAVLASGASPVQAMTAAAELPGPLAASLARGVHQVRNGRGSQEVLDEWANEHRELGAMLVADALALADTTGGSRTRALAGVRSTLRDADALAAETRALATQTRLSATVLTLVPVGFAALVAVADSRIAGFLLATPVGWACLVGGGALDSIGAWWMQRLMGRLR